jgi:hypothetical protein
MMAENGDDELGFTVAERTAWDNLVITSRSLICLPADHLMDQEELISVIHTLQRYLLSRPTYRKLKWLEAHRVMKEV